MHDDRSGKALFTIWDKYDWIIFTKNGSFSTTDTERISSSQNIQMLPHDLKYLHSHNFNEHFDRCHSYTGSMKRPFIL